MVLGYGGLKSSLPMAALNCTKMFTGGKFPAEWMEGAMTETAGPREAVVNLLTG